MKQLKPIKLTSIDPTKTYLATTSEYDRFGGGNSGIFKGTGKQMIKKVEDLFDFRSWMDTEVEMTGKEPKNPTKSFLRWVENEANGEDDFIQVFNF